MRRNIEPGEIITAPGVYQVDAEWYHSDCCDGPSISSTGLRTISAESPAHYWARSALNPARAPQRRSDALDFGLAAHAKVLGEPEFAAKFVAAPYDDFRSKEAREWRDAQTRVIVRAADLERIDAMAAALRSSPIAARAFADGVPELSLVWRDEATGVWLKARPDWLPHDPGARFIPEYKSALSAHPRAFAAAAWRYGYHIQAALMLDGIAAVTGKTPLGSAIVAQEKDPPYAVAGYLLSPEQIDMGRAAYRRALETFAACWSRWDRQRTDECWPAYSNDWEYLETPYWAAKEGLDHADEHRSDEAGGEYGAELAAG